MDKNTGTQTVKIKTKAYKHTHIPDTYRPLHITHIYQNSMCTHSHTDRHNHKNMSHYQGLVLRG